MRTRSVALVLGAIAGVLVACSGEQAETTSPTVSPTSTVAATTDAPPATAEGAATSRPPATSVVTTAPAAAIVYPTTTMHRIPADCDTTAMLTTVDRDLADARLVIGGAWSTDTDGVAFDERTNDAESFRARLGFDCTVRAVQRTDDGAERLLLAAWTGDRHAYVVQATDRPTVPYRREQRFELFIEWPYGEWIDDQFFWAGSLAGGETVVVSADDAPVAVAAKAWQRDAPEFVDLPVAIEVERYGIDLLVHAGARNVSVAEPAGYGTELSALQMVTPLGLHVIPTVGSIGWFDPAVELFPGRRSVERVGDVDVYVTVGDPEAYAVASVGWECDDHVWYFDAIWGTADELLDWAETLIVTAGCG